MFALSQAIISSRLQLVGTNFDFTFDPVADKLFVRHMAARSTLHKANGVGHMSPLSLPTSQSVLHSFTRTLK